MLDSLFDRPLHAPVVMGVLNITPDSFSDGGQLWTCGGFDHASLLRRAQMMIAAGAGFLDIGGESTRPGASAVSVEEELARVIPAVELLKAETDALVSVDTSTPEVISAAAAAGADLINDIRALSREGAMEAARASGLPICLMHMQGQPGTMQVDPQYNDVVAEVKRYLQQRVLDCEQAGIPRDRLILDPGFGFGKTLEHNLQLLNQLESFQEMGLPVLVGMSRKSMVGQVLDKAVNERLYGSLAAATIAVMKGADIIRVHDVAETSDVVKMAQAVKLQAKPV